MARVVVLEEVATVGSVQSHVMQVLVSLDLAACILARSPPPLSPRTICCCCSMKEESPLTGNL